jgi:aldehyde:ferredoxin oxidoreductase
MFDTTVSNTGTIETHVVFPRPQLGLPAHLDMWSPEEVSTLIAKTKGSMQFEDSLVLCRFVNGSDHKLLSAIVSAVTGWDFTLEKGMEIGRRTVNLLKVFNLRQGITAEMDAVPSARLTSAAIDGPCQGKPSIAPFWNDMVRNYYTLMGWDPETSKPLPSTLRNLGLEHIVADIWGKQGAAG